MKRFCLPILILFLGEIVLQGQDISVTAGFDSSKVFVGDQINFSVTVNQPAGLKLPFPYFKDTLVKNIEILSGPVVDTTVISDRMIKITGKYLVTSFDSGLYKIDPVFVEFRNSEGVKRFYSDYSILEVNRVRLTPPDTVTKIFDIIKPYKAPLSVADILPWVLLALFTGVIIWLLRRFIKKYRKVKKDIPEPVIAEPAHIIAFRELGILREEKLWQSGETKKYYTKLTEILRKYLENRFGVCSLELTTSETLEALVKTGFRKDDSYNLLKIVLNGADLVKFAKYRPEASENEQNFENSWKFVSVTKKEEQVEETSDINTIKKGGSV